MLGSLAKMLGLKEPSSTHYDFPENKAVVSHPIFKDARGEEKAIDYLGSVGFNTVPAWLRPFQKLSNGEQQRVLCAMLLREADSDASGADLVLDDFASAVDKFTAASMSVSIARQIRRRPGKRCLIATCKPEVIPYLAADMIIVLPEGKIWGNPHRLAERHLEIDWREPGILGYETGEKMAGWRGFVCDGGQLPRVEPNTAAIDGMRMWNGSKEVKIKWEVDADDATEVASAAFEFEFTGKKELSVPLLNREVIFRIGIKPTLGLIVGPSGTGKSTNLKELKRVMIRWPHVYAGTPGATEFGWEAPLQDLRETILAHSLLYHIEPYLPMRGDQDALLQAVYLTREAASKQIGRLSNTERERAVIAYRLVLGFVRVHPYPNSVMSFDEFCTHMDPGTAARVAVGVSSWVRAQQGKRYCILTVVFATVHDDLVKHMNPDWAFYTAPDRGVSARTGDLYTYTRGPDTLISDLGRVAWNVNKESIAHFTRRPKLELDIVRLPDAPGESGATLEAFYKIFEQYHYMDSKAPSGMKGVVVRERHTRKMVAFHGVHTSPGQNRERCLYEARLVVMPAFQGLGVGPMLSEKIGLALQASQLRMFANTAHPRLGPWRDRHPDTWIPGKYNGKESWVTKFGKATRTRVMYRHEFYGDEAKAAAWAKRVKELNTFFGDFKVTERDSNFDEVISLKRKRGEQDEEE